VFARGVDGFAEGATIAAAIVAVHIVLWLFLRFSVGIIKVIRPSGVTLITRISGILLSAIAVQLIADAINAFIAEA
jgi:multiple antibiotic resistance protein